MAGTLKRVSEKTWARMSKDDHGSIRVTSASGRAFVLPFDDLAMAGKVIERFDDRKAQLVELMDELLDWMGPRRPKIEKAFLAMQPTGVLLVVVRKESEFDPDFEGDLADLDIKVARDARYDLLRFRGLALPACTDEDVASFIDVGAAFVAGLDEDPGVE